MIMKESYTDVAMFQVCAAHLAMHENDKNF